MRRLSVKRRLFLVLVAGLAAILQSCGGEPTGGGDLVGVPNREAWGQTVPYGMVVCPSGTFHMGQADEISRTHRQTLTVKLQLVVFTWMIRKLQTMNTVNL